MSVLVKRVQKPEEIILKLRQVDLLRSQSLSMADAIRELGVSERYTFYVLSQHRSTQNHVFRRREDEGHLAANMIELARDYGRYGYRRIAALLRQAA